MTFLITLISFVIERFFHWGQRRHWRWFANYQLWLNTRIGSWPSALAIIVTVLPLVLLVGLVDYFLSGWLYNVLSLIFGVLILVYCMGPANVWVQAYGCISELNKDDPKLAFERAHAAFGVESPVDSQAFHQSLVKAMFIEAYQRVFSVLFWFVLLGPMGAVLYRLVALMSASAELSLASMAAKVQQVLDWVPARLFSFIFALGGHFNDVFVCWKKNVLKGLNSSHALLAECGVAALDILERGRMPEDGAAEKETVALLDRVFVMALVILAATVLLV